MNEPRHPSRSLSMGNWADTYLQLFQSISQDTGKDTALVQSTHSSRGPRPQSRGRTPTVTLSDFLISKNPFHFKPFYISFLNYSLSFIPMLIIALNIIFFKPPVLNEKQTEVEPISVPDSKHSKKGACGPCTSL